MLGFTQYTFIHYTTIDFTTLSFNLGKLEGAGMENAYIIDNIIAVWSTLGFVYFLCDPIIGSITYFAGLLGYLFVISIKELDSGEKPLLNGMGYNIFLYAHIFGWLT